MSGLHQAWNSIITKKVFYCIKNTTVDGSEIRDAPVDMVNIPLCSWFYTSKRWLGMGFLNHQQYFSVSNKKTLSTPRVLPDSVALT